MEMINFEKSDEEPDDVYNRRKKKVGDLLSKDQHLIDQIRKIRD